jgi:hypothetical protein
VSRLTPRVAVALVAVAWVVQIALLLGVVYVAALIVKAVFS